MFLVPMFSAIFAAVALLLFFHPPKKAGEQEGISGAPVPAH